MGRVKESREDRRLGPIIIRARFRIDGQDREGYLTNLSAGGAFLATEESLEIGESLDLKITLPWALGEVWVEARIVWSTERAGRAAQHLPLGVGLAFDRPFSPQADERLQKYMEHFRHFASQLEN